MTKNTVEQLATRKNKAIMMIALFALVSFALAVLAGVNAGLGPALATFGWAFFFSIALTTQAGWLFRLKRLQPELAMAKTESEKNKLAVDAGLL